MREKQTNPRYRTRENLSLVFDVGPIIRDEKKYILDNDSLISDVERNFLGALIEDACTILFHSCAYIMLEYEHPNAVSAVKQMHDVVCSDTSMMLDDLQLIDLSEGTYLQWVYCCGQSYTDESFLMEFVTGIHLELLGAFIYATVRRVYHELLYPAFQGKRPEVVDVEHLYKLSHFYKITVRNDDD